MERPLTREVLVERFHGYGQPRERWLIGGEFERILLKGDGQPVSYEEPYGIRWLLEQLIARFGWGPVYEEGNLIALERGRATTTLEPGCQVELSGAPFSNLHQLAEEAIASIGELQSVLEGHDLHLVALGLSPFVKMEDIPWVPKGRYRVMREYLGKTGELAHTMMKGTSSFQANFDFSDEADCARKVGVLGRIGPINTALFANSPIVAGQDSGWRSWRGYSWTRTDPARTGFPAQLREAYTHAGWVDYLLDVPMMFYKRDGRWTPALGRTFREYMERGLDGAYPTFADWELHQTSVFPEVRVKRTIEVRGADACPMHIAVGGIALWTGILYDDVALDQAAQLGRELAQAEPVTEQFLAACRDGLAAKIAGRPAVEWARELVRIAAGGLARSRPSERALLEPIEAMVAHGESPAVAVARIFKECPDPSVFLRRVRY